MKIIVIASSIIVALSGSILTGCASTNQMQLMRSAADNVIVDTKGVDMNKYQQDLSECAEYASRVDVAQNTGNAAVAGGLFGALIGGMAGNRNTAGIIGLLGAAEAAGQANQQSSNTVQKIMRECLRGRGYRVLN